MVVLRFWAPSGGLGATYDDHLRLIRKCIVDFLLVLIELFSLGVPAEALPSTSDYRFKNGNFAPTGAGWPTISGTVEGVDPHQWFFFSENLAKWSFIWYKNLDRFFFHFVTIHACDRQTDGETPLLQLDHPAFNAAQSLEGTFVLRSI